MRSTFRTEAARAHRGPRLSPPLLNPLLVALPLLAACGGGDSKAPEGAGGPALPPVEHTDVVEGTRAALLAGLPPLGYPEEPDGDPSDAEGLVTMYVSSSGAMRDLAFTDLEGQGELAGWALAKLLRNPEAPFAERSAAAEALGRLDTPNAASSLLEGIHEFENKALVAHCAYALARTTQDFVVPRLVLRLKYETDHEAWLWIADALAHFHNYAGLAGLHEVAATSAREDLRGHAAARLAAYADELGFESSQELQRHWDTGNLEERIPSPPAGDRHRLEIWKLIAQLDDFQLRPVDDGRWALSRLGANAVDLLAQALGDESRYIRLHAAQALDRMGPRGGAAGSSLLAALGDPTLAPQAAEALGSVGYPGAEPALRALLGPKTAPELRVAAARGLGRLALPESGPSLLELVADETLFIDLRVEAAAASLQTNPRDRLGPAVTLLTEHLTSIAIDPAVPESALDRWLRSLPQDLDGLPTLLESWDAARTQPNQGPQDAELEAERRSKRADLLRPAIADLTGN